MRFLTALVTILAPATVAFATGSTGRAADPDFRNVPVLREGTEVAGGLQLSRVEFDSVSLPGPAVAPGDAYRVQSLQKPGVAGRYVHHELLKIAEGALFEVPGASLLLAPDLTTLTVRTGGAGDGRITGRTSIPVLSRAGLTPARDQVAGVTITNQPIDQLGFALYWNSQTPPVGPRAKALMVIDARKVLFLKGRFASTVDIRFTPEVRDLVVRRLKDVLLEERTPGLVSAEVDLDRVAPEFRVFLLDLDYNSYGSYALANGHVRELTERARERRSVGSVIGGCVRRLTTTF